MPQNDIHQAHASHLPSNFLHITPHFNRPSFLAHFSSRLYSFPYKYNHSAICITHVRLSSWRPASLHIFNRFRALECQNRPFYYTWSFHRTFYPFMSIHPYRVSCCSGTHRCICSHWGIMPSPFHSEGCFSTAPNTCSHWHRNTYHDHPPHCSWNPLRSSCHLTLSTFPYPRTCHPWIILRGSLRCRNIACRTHMAYASTSVPHNSLINVLNITPNHHQGHS